MVWPPRAALDEIGIKQRDIRIGPESISLAQFVTRTCCFMWVLGLIFPGCAVALLCIFCLLRCATHEEIEVLAFDLSWLRLQQNRDVKCLVVDVCSCVQGFFPLRTGHPNPPEGVVFQGLETSFWTVLLSPCCLFYDGVSVCRCWRSVSCSNQVFSLRFCRCGCELL